MKIRSCPHILYRGRNYNPKKRPVIPVMLWKPHEPVYPRLIKTTINGLSIKETKEIWKRGLAVPALTKFGMCMHRSLISVASMLFVNIIDSEVNCSNKRLLCFFGTHGQRCLPCNFLLLHNYNEECLFSLHD